MQKIEDIDLELEKLVFLNSAWEGAGYLYELTWELGHYDLLIEDKYKICREMVTKLVSLNLVSLEKFKDITLKQRLQVVHIADLHEVLNNPSNWYPCNDEIYAIQLTQLGENYLNEISELNCKKLHKRIFIR